MPGMNEGLLFWEKERRYPNSSYEAITVGSMGTDFIFDAKFVGKAIKELYICFRIRVYISYVQNHIRMIWFLSFYGWLSEVYTSGIENGCLMS